MLNLAGNNHPRKYFSCFYKYFLSYVLLLILVLSILGMVVHRNFRSTMQREVKRSNLSSVLQVKDTMDTRLQEMERIALNISYNDNLRYYNISNGNYESLQAVKELKKYKSSSGFIYDIALFYNHYKDESGGDNKRIYTTTTSVTLDMFFKYVYQFENKGKDDFLNMTGTLDTPKMYPVSHALLNNHQHAELAAYVYPLAINTIQPCLDVVFFIQKDTLNDILRNALGMYNGYVYVLDRQGDPVFYHTDVQTAQEQDVILKKAGSVLSDPEADTIDINGSNYSVARIVSEYNGWSYLVIRETNQLIHDINTSKKVFQYVTVLVLLSGLIIAYFLANGQYKPWKELLEVIPEQGIQFDNQSYSSEFELVMKTIMGVSTENRKLSTQLRSRSALLRDQFIMKLLNGKMSDPEEQENMQGSYGLQLPFPWFVVLVFLPDADHRTDADKQEGIQDLAVFSIKNVTEELSEEIGCGYGVESADGKGVALLLNLKEEYAKDRYISDLAFRTKDFFTKYFGFTMTVGVGNTYHSTEMIHESYLEANRAVYYRLIKGYGNVIFHENIKERQKKMYQYPAMLEQELIIAIKGGKSDEARSIILNIKEHIKNHSPTIEAVQCICFGIINTIMKVLNDLNLDSGPGFTDEKESLFSQPFDTVDVLMDRIISFCATICNYIQEQKESRNFELREEILNLVADHYRDSSLSLDSIAQEFHMSPSYISRYFKDQTGYSLMQYVDQIRMNEVKRLLRESDDSLNDIIRQVGYVDKSSFYRKFKKKEGVTPVQYRSIIRNGRVEANSV